MGLRNKARLTTGEIVEYDEAIEVDPADPETPKPAGNCETKYLGIGEIVEVRSTPQTQDGRLLHLWEYLPKSGLFDYWADKFRGSHCVDSSINFGAQATEKPQNSTPKMTQEQLFRLMDSAPNEDGYRRSTEFQPAPKTRLFSWNPPQIFQEYKTH